MHSILYSQDADATSVFLRDVLGFESADAGRGWLIFALPPSELGIHPAEVEPRVERYLTRASDTRRDATPRAERGVSSASARGIDASSS